MGEANNLSEKKGNAQKYSYYNQRAINPHPFKLFHNRTTGKYINPRLSLRRQAQLGKQAFAEGRFDELIQQIDRLNFGNEYYAGEKLNKMRSRIAEIKAEEQDLQQKAMSGELEQMKGPKRRQNITDRLSKMDQTIVDWRKQRKDVKTKAKPKLPF
ncbi:uncharacterized protein FA14DRAFT_122174 [Meira miltonrushii]|uniref:Large ribosomal subunit protein mL59 domain-containing protein n=1 Tax=Meira miltonrushii TaxID=1280837 RepID=A0A316VDB1_9BASI|nr:uncharacterized protein FA14DRAFT_122174 [Meira miltonrushii]PWN35078.1 hypothetical protein FA14DRAFT_122174 [Meira miltonrushii]